MNHAYLKTKPISIEFNVDGVILKIDEDMISFSDGCIRIKCINIDLLIDTLTDLKAIYKMDKGQ